LGWELHMDRADVVTVYEALMAAGQEHDIRNAGYRAIESLRLEKGYRAWGADIGPDRTPLEAGMAWAVKLDSGMAFKGGRAIAAQRAEGPTALLACFTVDDPDVVLLGRETIYRNGERVGWLTSAGWGYSIGTNIGYGYVHDAQGVDRAHLAAGSYELEVATRRLPAQLHLRPLYDPEMAKIRC
jgi:glycine cleavage system aminomethyltransferase T